MPLKTSSSLRSRWSHSVVIKAFKALAASSWESKELGTRTSHSRSGGLSMDCAKYRAPCVLGDLTNSSCPIPGEKEPPNFGQAPPQVPLPKVADAGDGSLQATLVSPLLIFTQSEKCSGTVLRGLPGLFHFKCSLVHKAERGCCVSLFHCSTVRNVLVFYL